MINDKDKVGLKNSVKVKVILLQRRICNHQEFFVEGHVRKTKKTKSRMKMPVIEKVSKKIEIN